ncbi:MAG: cupredoxin domain-containing protein [Dehalococcoidia bacterium]|nr:cupredoxin domain-containing protein [Dehalococcoidia bacterium]
MTPRRVIRSIASLAVTLALLQAWLPEASGGPLSAPDRAAFVVTMVDNAFQPQSITIQVGDSVTWVNNGATSHTATSDNALWDSGIMPPGQSFSRSFSSTGTFQYRCSIHGSLGMIGTIVVQAAGQPAATPTLTPTTTPTPTGTPTTTPTPTQPLATPTFTPSPGPNPAVPAATPASASLTGKPTILISIVDNRFMPQNLSVGVRSTIIWTNNGAVPHTVTSDTGLWDSVTLSPSQTFSRSLDAPSSYFYHCEFHRGAGMVGVITVTGIALATPTTTQSPVTATPTPGSATAVSTPGPAPAPSSGTPVPTPLPPGVTPFPRTLPATGDPGSLSWPLVIAGCLLLAGLAARRTDRR